MDSIIDEIFSLAPPAPDLTPVSEAELDRLTDQLAEKLETHTYATKTDHHKTA